MPCYYPLPAFQLPGGRVQIGFDRGDGRPLRVPCGGCIGCKLERARQWAVRCMHEASLYDENCFITLTYSDEKLPAGGSLNPDDLQAFMKALRKHIAPRKVRFYGCGEYGTRYGRPHYHVLLFGYDFPDKVFFSERSGFNVYTSALLCRLWGRGLCEVGTVTYESAAYVARYVVHKDHRQVLGVDADGEVRSLDREFSRMSRRPGIGAEWFKRYGKEVYSTDGVVVNGQLRKPPRYYDVAAALEMPDEWERIREERRRARRTDLEAAEKNVRARYNLKPREF